MSTTTLNTVPPAVLTAYVDAFNRGDLDGLCQLFTPDALVFGVLGWGEIGKVRPIWSQLMSGLRMNLTIDAVAVDGSTVAVRYTERGTFSAPFRGAAPTGKSYEIVAMEWFELEGDLIRRRWGARDSATIARQVGLPLS